MRFLAAIAGLALCGVFASASQGAPRRAHLAEAPIASFQPITGRATTPWGWVDFCSRYNEDCAGGPLAAEDIALTPKAWALIQRVNERVNRTIRPLSDMDHWGVVDQWDLPLDGYGDCEDYALLKRKMLIDAGLPRQALLMTVVKDEHGEGHAILSVHTDHGDFILDNMREGVHAWDQVPYTFVKRQSQTDPDMWEQIGPPTDAPLTVAR